MLRVRGPVDVLPSARPYIHIQKKHLGELWAQLFDDQGVRQGGQLVNPQCESESLFFGAR